MAPNFRKIQQTYPDALRLVAKRFKGSDPIGEEHHCRMLGGGKVLYYSVTATSETIIVSKIAQTKITIICGPQGRGKTSLALAMARAYKPEEHAYFDYGWLIGGECIVPPNTKVVVIDDFPKDGNFGLLLSGFLCEKSARTLAVHVIACVQIALDGFEPKFLIGDKRLNEHPVEYIDLQKQSAS